MVKNMSFKDFLISAIVFFVVFYLVNFFFKVFRISHGADKDIMFSFFIWFIVMIFVWNFL
jgi:hypothetical protein